jgi:hypothetical protein
MWSASAPTRARRPRRAKQHVGQFDDDAPFRKNGFKGMDRDPRAQRVAVAAQVRYPARMPLDVIDFIRVRAKRLVELRPASGVMSVVRHVEAAERHLKRAMDDDDAEYCNDVVYRTNQAFEGSLKEAYAILAQKDPTKKTPAEIEAYLDGSKVFAPRVVTLFTQYRQQWRNPSTHDHSIEFRRDEAFLAMLSVSAFAVILLDQMLERATFEKEQAELAARPAKPMSAEPMIDWLPLALGKFGNELASRNADLSEVELLGAVRAFLETTFPKLVVRGDVVGSDEFGRLRPDLVVSRDGEALVLEVYRYKSLRADFERQKTDQLRRYMRVFGTAHGVMFTYPARDAVPTGERYHKIIGDASDPDHLVVRVHVPPPLPPESVKQEG